MSEVRSSKDVIRVKNLLQMVSFSDGAQWDSTSPKLQPVHITLDVTHDTSEAAETDDLVYSIDYSSVCKTIIASCEGKVFSSLESLHDHIHDQCFEKHQDIQLLGIYILRPRGLLHPATTAIQTTARRTGPVQGSAEKLHISNLNIRTIVGINECEREDSQLVHFDLTFHRSSKRKYAFPFRTMERRIRDDVSKSSFLTLEALASSVARLSLEALQDDCEYVTVKASKPSALVCAEAPEVEITRALCDGALVPYPFDETASTVASDITTTAHAAPAAFRGLIPPSESTHLAAIGIGSNLGDRFANIELALRLLEKAGAHYSRLPEDASVTVVDTSFMYETEPMYVTDQPKFANCACLIETNLSPMQLLNLLKITETAVGRVASFRNGPRAIDLDILLYDAKVFDTRPTSERDLDDLDGHLVIPHPKMLEREFVLRPLCDMVPDCIHPIARRTIEDLLDEVVSKQQEPQVMHKIIPFPQYPLPESTLLSNKTASQLPDLPPIPPTATYWKFPVSSSSSHNTYIMGTLNATPDSFSDGSVNNTIPAGLAYAKSAVKGGAHIIDVGGYSTRPGAEFVSNEEEIARVVPMIQAIRSYQSSDDEDEDAAAAVRETLISVDTFRLQVAESAIRAGANCINDVYAFTGPRYPIDEAGRIYSMQMCELARDLAVPVILMHSRGEASANKDYSEFSYASDSRGRGAIIEAIKEELGDKVDGLGGVRRWFVIVDPGIGFSKTVEDNLEVLRNAAHITGDRTKKDGKRNPLYGYPQLIGASRKSFLGAILQKPDSASAYKGRETKPVERSWATAAAVACAVQQGAAVVRVHDVLELGDAVRVSQAIWGE